MPDGAVYVGRPTKWGNPFIVGAHYRRGPHKAFGSLAALMVYTQATDGYQDATYTTIANRAEAVDWFRWWLQQVTRDITGLRGKDLACWCPLDQPCHADVLLELANALKA